MATISIYYGSSGGNTEDVAKKIAKALNLPIDRVFDVAKATADFSDSDTLLFGSSTLGLGDLQDDWDFFLDKVKTANLAGKKIALFGCGDSSSYSDTFCDALSKIYQGIQNKGIILIGRTSTDGYTYDSSESVIDGQFLGLAIDEDNEPHLTDARIARWVENLKKEI